jgi:ABC-type nitrate/sulfonate/bicarbonate transport system ATPase subunit
MVEPSKISAPAAPAVASNPVPKLLIENLAVDYVDQDGNRVHAVEEISLSIADKPGCGEIVVFLGPSGCGKSTILKCVAGLLEPARGKILIDGQPVVGTSRDRGMVFQAYTSFAWMNVLHNVEYGLRIAGMPKEQREAKAKAVLQQVGLLDFANKFPKALSGGMKQRVAIARTLVNDPRVVLMDEPFGALDPETRWGMQSLLLDISKKMDNTILFVTHDVAEAIYLADTVFILSPRPAKILHRLDVPAFAERDFSLRHSPKFKEVEAKILDLLHGIPGQFRI